MNDDDRVDLVKAERYRAEANVFELFRKDWENGSGTTKGELVKLMRDSSRFLVHQETFLFDWGSN